MGATVMTTTTAHTPGPPLWLLAELTYRCPLHCVFCFNPVDFAKHEDELSTEDWLRVLNEARAMGSVQCGFSGGEPMLRDDLEILVAEAHRLGYLHQPAHLRRGAQRGRRRGTQGSGAGPHPAVLPGLHPGDERLPVPHAHLRAEQRVAKMIKDKRLAHGHERGDPSPHIEHVGRIIEMAAELDASTWSWPTPSTTPGPW